PVCRALVIHTPGAYWFVFTVHHIAFDGWSIRVLLDELHARYADARSGRDTSPPEPWLQYADYVAWQQRTVTPARLSADLTYWQQALAGSVPLQLPTDHPREASSSRPAGLARFTLDPGVTRSLADLASQERSTMFMSLLTGFALLLQRYTGVSDL